MTGVLGLLLVGISCGSDSVAGPSLEELRGEWTMSWTENGEGISCTWANVSLSLRDSTKGAPGYWGGGDGACLGLINNDRLVLVTLELEDLSVESGHIHFVPQSSTYQFNGRVEGDEMSGTMSSNLRYADPNVQVPTRGRWRAVRSPTP